MEAFTLRPYTPADMPVFEGWWEADQTGVERLLGGEVPDKTTLALAVAYWLQAQAHQQALLQVVTRENVPYGVVGVTDITPHGAGRVHIFVDPTHRRYSVTIGQLALEQARQLGLQLAIATVHEDNTAALALTKLLGFEQDPVITLYKPLVQEPTDGRSPTVRPRQSRRRRSRRRQRTRQLKH